MHLGKLAKLFSIAAVVIFPQPSLAELSEEAVEAALRVNMAGRQRMLSQRMVKAACLMVQDVAWTASFDQLTQAYDLFVRSDQALRDGDAGIGLAPESYPPVIEAQRQSDVPWSIYRIVIESGIDTADISADQLLALDDAGLTLLRQLNNTVFATAQAHAAAAPKVSLGLTVTVDVAGRQRMLSQRAVKEACLLNAAVAPEEQSSRLLATIDLFDRSLAALQDGHRTAGIIAPPNAEVARKLAEVAALWRPIKAMLLEAAEAGEMTSQNLSRLTNDAEPLLRTMNEAVGLYGI